MRTRSIGIFNIRTSQLRNAIEVTRYDASTISALKDELRTHAYDPWVVVDSDESLDVSLAAMQSILDPMAEQTPPPIVRHYRQHRHI